MNVFSQENKSSNQINTIVTKLAHFFNSTPYLVLFQPVMMHGDQYKNGYFLYSTWLNSGQNNQYIERLFPFVFKQVEEFKKELHTMSHTLNININPDDILNIITKSGANKPGLIEKKIINYVIENNVHF